MGYKSIWSDPEDVLKKLRIVYKESPDKLQCRKAVKELSGPYKWACIHFGTWKNALETAGIAYSEIRANLEWTDESVLDAIRTIGNKNIKDLSGTINGKVPGPLYSTARYRFGNWKKAVKAAGFDYADARAVQTKEELVAEIQVLGENDLTVLQSGKIRKAHAVLYQRSVTQFGSWEMRLRLRALFMVKYEP